MAHPDLADVLLLAAVNAPGEPASILDDVDLAEKGALFHLHGERAVFQDGGGARV